MFVSLSVCVCGSLSFPFSLSLSLSIYIYMHVHTYIYICVCVSLSVSVSVSLCICVPVSLRPCVSVCPFLSHAHTHSPSRSFACACVRAHTCSLSSSVVRMFSLSLILRCSQLLPLSVGCARCVICIHIATPSTLTPTLCLLCPPPLPLSRRAPTGSDQSQGGLLKKLQCGQEGSV